MHCSYQLIVWQNFSNLTKSDSSNFQYSFATSPAAAADFFHRNGAHHRPLRENPQSVIPESTHKNPENPTKLNEINKTLCTKFAFFLLTTHALARSGSSSSFTHRPASSFLTALVVVYTPIMLGSAFTAHAHKHTTLLGGGGGNRNNGFCDHLAQQQLSPQAHTHTNTTTIEHSPQPRGSSGNFENTRMKRKRQKSGTAAE